MRDFLPLIATLALAACASEPSKAPDEPSPPAAIPAPAQQAAPASPDSPKASEPPAASPAPSVPPTHAAPRPEPDQVAATPEPAAPPAAAPFSDAASVERWMASYYLHPELDRFVEAFRALDAGGAFANEARAWGYSAFFTELMRRNPGSVPMWCDAVGAVKEPSKKWWWTAVWQADTEGGAQAIKEARALPQGHERRIEYRWLDDKHRDILQTQIRGPQQIDMLWRAFGASGDELFVLKQFEGLVEFKVREPTTPAEETIAERRRETARRTAAIARQRLLEHCQDEPRVLEICKANASRLKPGSRLELEKVIAQAEGRPIPTAPTDPKAPAAPGPGE